MPDTTATNHDTISNGDTDKPMKDIPSLTQEIQRLGDSSDWWVGTGIILTGLVAFLGILLFIAQWRAIIVGNSRDATRETLGKAKDKEFQLQLADANSKAESARESAAKVEQDNLKLEIQLEAERRERADLEASIARRDLDIKRIDSKRLRLSGRVNAMIVFANASEPIAAADAFKERFEFATWNVTEFRSIDDDELPFKMDPGIFVLNSHDLRHTGDGGPVEALLEELSRVNVAAKTFPSDGIPKNSVRILIGPSDKLPGDERPSGVPANIPLPAGAIPYTMQDSARELKEERAAAEQRDIELRKQLETAKLPDDTRAKAIDLARLQESLKMFTSKRVGVSCTPEPESLDLAKTLAKAFADAGCPEMPVAITKLPIRLGPGVYLLSSDPDTSDVEPLAQALIDVGVEDVAVVQTEQSAYLNLVAWDRAIVAQGAPEIEILVAARKRARIQATE